MAGASPVAKAFLADVGAGAGQLPRYMAWRDAASTLAFIVGPLLSGHLYMGKQAGGLARDQSLAAVISTSGLYSLLAGTLVALLSARRRRRWQRGATAPKGGGPAARPAARAAGRRQRRRRTRASACPLGTQLVTAVATVCVVSALFNCAAGPFDAFFPSLSRSSSASTRWASAARRRRSRRSRCSCRRRSRRACRSASAPSPPASSASARPLPASPASASPPPPRRRRPVGPPLLGGRGALPGGRAALRADGADDAAAVRAAPPPRRDHGPRLVAQHRRPHRRHAAPRLALPERRPRRVLWSLEPLRRRLRPRDDPTAGRRLTRHVDGGEGRVASACEERDRLRACASVPSGTGTRHEAARRSPPRETASPCFNPLIRAPRTVLGAMG